VIPRAFLVAAGSERCALTPATRRYPFRRNHPDAHLVFSDFGQGGDAPWSPIKEGKNKRSSSLSERERVSNIIKILRLKKLRKKISHTRSRTIRKAGNGFGWVRRYLFLT
jgi:hypothetical protein